MFKKKITKGREEYSNSVSPESNLEYSWTFLMFSIFCIYKKSISDQNVPVLSYCVFCLCDPAPTGCFGTCRFDCTTWNSSTMYFSSDVTALPWLVVFLDLTVNEQTVQEFFMQREIPWANADSFDFRAVHQHPWSHCTSSFLYWKQNTIVSKENGKYDNFIKQIALFLAELASPVGPV